MSAALKTAYVVMVDNEHEVTPAVAVFDTRARADAFALLCHEHDRKQPQTPATIDDSDGNDLLWQKWARANRLWLKRHPGGEAAAGRGVFVAHVPHFVGR